MKSILLLIIAIGLCYFVFLKLSPHDEVWLHGTWKYQGDSIDYMTFYKDGAVEMHDRRKVYYRCVYASLTKSEVSVECTIGGGVKELVFSVSDDLQVITNKSQPDSVYKKTKS